MTVNVSEIVDGVKTPLESFSHFQRIELGALFIKRNENGSSNSKFATESTYDSKRDVLAWSEMDAVLPPKGKPVLESVNTINTPERNIGQGLDSSAKRLKFYYAANRNASETLASSSNQRKAVANTPQEITASTPHRDAFYLENAKEAFSLSSVDRNASRNRAISGAVQRKASLFEGNSTAITTIDEAVTRILSSRDSTTLRGSAKAGHSNIDYNQINFDRTSIAGTTPVLKKDHRNEVPKTGKISNAGSGLSTGNVPPKKSLSSQADPASTESPGDKIANLTVSLSQRLYHRSPVDSSLRQRNRWIKRNKRNTDNKRNKRNKWNNRNNRKQKIKREKRNTEERSKEKHEMLNNIKQEVRDDQWSEKHLPSDQFDSLLTEYDGDLNDPVDSYFTGEEEIPLWEYSLEIDPINENETNHHGYHSRHYHHHQQQQQYGFLDSQTQDVTFGGVSGTRYSNDSNEVGGSKLGGGSYGDGSSGGLPGPVSGSGIRDRHGTGDGNDVPSTDSDRSPGCNNASVDDTDVSVDVGNIIDSVGRGDGDVGSGINQSFGVFVSLGEVNVSLDSSPDSVGGLTGNTGSGAIGGVRRGGDGDNGGVFPGSGIGIQQVTLTSVSVTGVTNRPRAIAAIISSEGGEGGRAGAGGGGGGQGGGRGGGFGVGGTGSIGGGRIFDDLYDYEIDISQFSTKKRTQRGKSKRRGRPAKTNRQRYYGNESRNEFRNSFSSHSDKNNYDGPSKRNYATYSRLGHQEAHQNGHQQGYQDGHRRYWSTITGQSVPDSPGHSQLDTEEGIFADPAHAADYGDQWTRSLSPEGMLPHPLSSKDRLLSAVQLAPASGQYGSQLGHHFGHEFTREGYQRPRHQALQRYIPRLSDLVR